MPTVRRTLSTSVQQFVDRFAISPPLVERTADPVEPLGDESVEPVDRLIGPERPPPAPERPLSAPERPL
jgi:hypothetical protein